MSRILAIDDDLDILSILEIIFEHEGFELVPRQTCPTVDEIIALKPDLILLDVRIEGFHKTGIEVCSEFKSNAEIAHIPVILVSAEHRLEKLADQCGADSFVAKPFDILKIVNKVKDFLS